MPRAKGNASSVAKPVEPEKPIESEEKVDFYGDIDPEEEMEEDVEYEEIEEEEEVEVEVEEEEEEEDEEEAEVEEDMEDEDANNATGTDIQKSRSRVEVEDKKEKHAELLALPPHGSEVYIGGIPHNASEEDLKIFCEAVGKVTEVRIMKGKDSGENKVFAFVTFKNVEMASAAIEELNNTQFKGRRIKCSTSKAKHRLFIGNVPRSWGEEDLRKVVMKIGPGVTGVELVKDMKNTNNNRGFSFVDYYNHACADYSREKMMDPKFKLDSNAPTVSWADPKNDESSAASQIKAVYVKNLPENVTQDQLKKLFEHHGKITKVVVPAARSGQEKSRIGFVHFSERSSAMKALESSKTYELDGQMLECSLARPQADLKSSGSNSPRSGLVPSYPPHFVYGMAGSAYGGFGTGYGAAGFAQSLMPGPGPAPAGMAMMPMLLPDGQIGYVLQQPGGRSYHPSPSYQRRSGRGGGGGSGNKSSGGPNKGRHSNDSGHGRRYHPY